MDSPDQVRPADSTGNVPPAGPPTVRQVVITTGTIWRAVAIVLVTLAALWGLNQMRSLVMMLAVSVFFALALTPGVNYLHAKRGWRRGPPSA